MAHYKKRTLDRQRPVPKSPELHGAMCKLCPLNGSEPVFGDGPKDPLLAIVGDTPGRDEVEGGIPFIGRAGQLVADLLAAKKLSRSEVLLDNAVACFPPGGDMKAFLQRAKKAWNAEQELKLKAAKGDKDKTRALKSEKFHSPVDCCRPRLFLSLGIERCAKCRKWNVVAGKFEDASRVENIACRCETPSWVKSTYGEVKAVVAAGNAALESVTGSGGIQKKQMYVFENKKRGKK